MLDMPVTLGLTQRKTSLEKEMLPQIIFAQT